MPAPEEEKVPRSRSWETQEFKSSRETGRLWAQPCGKRPYKGRTSVFPLGRMRTSKREHLRGSSKVEKARGKRANANGPACAQGEGEYFLRTNAEPPLGLRELGRVEELPGL